MIRRLINLFRKPIIIPLVRKGIPTGQWIEVKQEIINL